MKIDGAVLAIDRLGQRDTWWLFPLTVSGGYQGEEGGRHISGACSYPTAASAFSSLTAYKLHAALTDLLRPKAARWLSSI